MRSATTSLPDFQTLRHLQIEATQRLLGDTIDLADADWREPTGLPGWSRAHVVSHLARHAQASATFIGHQLNETPAPLYPSREERDTAIEAGAVQSGLELQTDLDRTAGELERALDSLAPEHRERPATLREGLTLPLGLLPLVRLCEVALHHVDLGIGLRCADLPPAAALAMLQFYLGVRLADREDYPEMTLVPDEAPEQELRLGPPGSTEPGPRVQQSAATLLGLLTRRIEPADVPGAESLRLPSLG